MTIFEAYNDTKKKLEAAGIEDYVFESKQIIMHITGFTPAQILTDYNKKLTQFEENNLVALVHQRQIRYPLQYIFGSWDFYGRPFKVGPGVLIPRADTEIAVEAALEILKEKQAPLIADLCAGSGCIGITLGLQIPEAKVTLVEKYEEAMRYTLHNIERNEAVNTRCLRGDVLEKSEFPINCFDLIISNPPYIPKEEMKYTSKEVAFEPETALIAEDGGLEFYKAITENYTHCLKPGGHIVFEVGFKQAAAVGELLSAKGYENITYKKDLNGIDRVVIGEWRK